MAERARVLVQGATGFTGGLVCEALKRRGIAFAIGGRNGEKLEKLAAALGGDVERCVIDVTSAASVDDAIAKRSIVCACAGPFVKVGEPVLAACARLGVHYVDTTGEQTFVANAVTRHHAVADASGACVVPGMAFEIAPADWGAHVAAMRVGGAPDSIVVVYMNQPPDEPGAAAKATTRGTKRSILTTIGDRESRQFVDGALVQEASAAKVGHFPLRSGKMLCAASFASPEAIVVPSHTGARSVRTFMAMDAMSARALQLGRGVAPAIARLVAPLVDRAIDRAAAGPDEAFRRASTFEIYVEAQKGDETARLWVHGRDPYGLTAEIQAHAAERAIGGKVIARGVVAPSVGYPPEKAMAALAFTEIAMTS